MRAVHTIALFLAITACGQAETVDQIDRFSLDHVTQNAPEGPLASSPKPARYVLDLVIDPREDQFSGTVEITVNFSEAATGFYLHGADLAVINVTITDATGRKFDGTWHDILPSGVAWLQFSEPVEPGQVTVAITYHALFDTNLAGLFKVTEQGDSYALAKSESIQARRFMPGFDQPAFKAPFDVTLTIPEADIAIGNAPEASWKLTGSGHARVTFETTRPLPTYLLSLAVGPFDVVEVGDIPANDVRAMPVPLTGYARRGKGPELSYVLATTPELVRLFEEAYQYPYPYQKLDIIAAPQWPSGATELASAITYRESRILAGPETGPAARRNCSPFMPMKSAIAGLAIW